MIVLASVLYILSHGVSAFKQIHREPCDFPHAESVHADNWFGFSDMDKFFTHRMIYEKNFMRREQ